MANKITYKHLKEIRSGRKLDEKVYPPRIQTLAKFIQDEYPDLKVRLTDVRRESKRARDGNRKVYTGKRLTVTKGSSVVFDHDPTDPYNTNYRIVDWLLEQRKKVNANAASAKTE